MKRLLPKAVFEWICFVIVLVILGSQIWPALDNSQSIGGWFRR